MKTYTLLSCLILLGGCKTSTIPNNSSIVVGTSKIEKNKEYCPKDGECNITLHQNASILLKQDTPNTYYPTIEKGEKIVVVFEFLIKGPEGTADGDYSETIHFEIDKDVETLNINGEKLKQANLIFGKHCFCRGEAGYYKIKEGNLSIHRLKDNISMDLSFKINEISHKINRINKVIKI